MKTAARLRGIFPAFSKHRGGRGLCQVHPHAFPLFLVSVFAPFNVCHMSHKLNNIMANERVSLPPTPADTTLLRFSWKMQTSIYGN